MFTLNPTLKADTFEVGQFPLCLVLLMNNRQFPWVILVPKRTSIRELYELNHKDQHQALTESIVLSEALMNEFSGDKLNTAAIGNIVPQLHLHHIIRFKHDPVWPQPIWGNTVNKPYTRITSRQMLKRLRTMLSNASQAFTATL